MVSLSIELECEEEGDQKAQDATDLVDDQSPTPHNEYTREGPYGGHVSRSVAPTPHRFSFETVPLLPRLTFECTTRRPALTNDPLRGVQT